MGELLGMLLEGKPANWQNRQPQRNQSNKPKRGEFGDGWHCGSCGFYKYRLGGGYKPDHFAVAIEMQSHFKESQYLGVQKAPVANLEQAHDRFHVNGSQWAAAMDRQD
eukprot:342358-Amphidinium_carterae.1